MIYHSGGLHVAAAAAKTSFQFNVAELTDRLNAAFDLISKASFYFDQPPDRVRDLLMWDTKGPAHQLHTPGVVHL